MNKGMIRSFTERLFSAVMSLENILDLVLLNRVSG
jgi:hypothetical protein